LYFYTVAKKNFILEHCVSVILFEVGMLARAELNNSRDRSSMTTSPSMASSDDSTCSEVPFYWPCIVPPPSFHSVVAKEREREQEEKGHSGDISKNKSQTKQQTRQQHNHGATASCQEGPPSSSSLATIPSDRRLVVVGVWLWHLDSAAA
jgi:hypothetical protein